MKIGMILVLTCTLLLASFTGCSISRRYQLSYVDPPQAGEFAAAENDMEELQKKYPQYFNLHTFKGLEVYVWQLEDVYYCGVLEGTNRLKTQEELDGLRANALTIAQMKVVLASYDIPWESIAILPIDVQNSFQDVSIPDELRALFED